MISGDYDLMGIWKPYALKHAAFRYRQLLQATSSTLNRP